MDGVPNIAGFAAAARHAQEARRREERRIDGRQRVSRPTRDDDVVELDHTEAIEALRDLKDPTSEEAQDERAAHAKPSSPPPRRLDISG